MGIETKIKNELLKCNTDECERLYVEFLNIISPTKYVNFISANLRLLTTIYNISESADISADYDLEKLSNIQTINSVRMEAAENLLKTTNLTISQISNETGYLSSSYFCTLFKKKYNITPNEYRNKFRN